MTARQRSLARHALGLRGRYKTSYRNRFVAGKDDDDYADWMAMVDAGEAQRLDGNRLPYAGDDLFWLTLKGAEQALNQGEKLDPEDFPVSVERSKPDAKPDTQVGQ